MNSVWIQFFTIAKFLDSPTVTIFYNEPRLKPQVSNPSLFSLMLVNCQTRETEAFLCTRFLRLQHFCVSLLFISSFLFPKPPSSFDPKCILSTFLLYYTHVQPVQFSGSVMADSLQPHGLQYARLPCPSPTAGAFSNSCPLSWWCHPIISSSVVPFFFCLQSFPAPGSFPKSQFFVSGGQSIGRPTFQPMSNKLSYNFPNWPSPNYVALRSQTHFHKAQF